MLIACALLALFAGVAARQPGNLVALPFSRGHRIFTSREQTDGVVAFCVQDGLRGLPRTVLTSREAPLMKAMPLNDFAVSDDGRLCAYFVTQADPRYEAIRLVDVESGKKLDDAVFWTHNADFGWRADGFYYGGYRKPESSGAKFGEERVLFHRIGTSQSDDPVVYADTQHPSRKYLFLTTFDHRFMLLHVLERANGRVLTSEWFRREGAIDGKFKAILPEPALGRTYLCDNVGDTLILHTTYKSPSGRIVAVDTRHPDEAHWKTLVEGPLEEADMVLGRLTVLAKQPDGSITGRFYSADGRPEDPIPIQPGTTLEIQACRKGEPYVFLSMTSQGIKRYFYADRRVKKLIPFQ